MTLDGCLNTLLKQGLDKVEASLSQQVEDLYERLRRYFESVSEMSE